MSSLYKKRYLFNVQRLMLLGLMVLVLSTALTLTTGVASAKTVSAASSILDPISTGCANDAQTRQWNVGSIPDIFGMTASIYLRYSPSCKTEWAKIVLNRPLTSGYEVNAIVTRNYDELQYDCTTGDQVVTPNETSCYSRMVYAGPGTYSTGYATAMYHVIGERWLEFTRTISG